MKSHYTTASAELSDCGAYRYSLHRRWGTGATLVFVMLNPSTADQRQDDPTIRRCVGFAMRDGFEAITVVNLFAWRATSPRELATAADPVGPKNNEAIAAALDTNLGASPANAVVAAWGTRVDPIRARIVSGLLRLNGAQVSCLGLTKDGHPRHPLYVPGTQPRVPWLEMPC